MNESHSDRQTDRQTDSATGLTGTAGGVGVVKPRQTATFMAARCHYTRRVDGTVAVVVCAVVHLCIHHPSADQSASPPGLLARLAFYLFVLLTGPIYKISYDLSYDCRKFIVRSTYDSHLKRVEISLRNIVS